jgi:hypothetical protein
VAGRADSNATQAGRQRTGGFSVNGTLEPVEQLPTRRLAEQRSFNTGFVLRRAGRD